MSVLLSLDAIVAIVLQGVYEKMLFFSWYSLQDPGKTEAEKHAGAVDSLTEYYAYVINAVSWNIQIFFLISMKIKLHNVRIFNKYSIFILTAYPMLLNVKCLPSNYISKRIRRNIMSFFVVILCYGRLTPLTFNNIISNIVVPSFVVGVTEQVVSSTPRQGR